MQPPASERPLTRRLPAILLAIGLASPPAGAMTGVEFLPRRPQARRQAAAAVSTPLSVPAPPPGASPGWWATVQADIRAAEYSVTWQEKTLLPEERAAYQAPNRAQNLRTYFTAEGVRVLPRTAGGPPWQVGLSLTRVGAGSRLAPARGAKPQTSGNKVEYRRDGVTEWYLNDERGLEQGFLVATRPGARSEGALRLALAVSGNTTPRLSADGQAVEFLAPGGALALRYAELVAVDALGHSLASRMELSGCAGEPACALHLVVEDARATYPVSIDPLATSPNWTVDSDQPGAQLGFSVGAAGDVNADGHADVIVGAPFYDNGQADEGRAFVFHGSGSGLSVTPGWTAEGDQASAQFGSSVATAGDVNGDGSADVLVGAPFHDNGQTDEGRAYAYLGSPSGLAAAPGWTAESDQAGAQFGVALAAAGDVNGDGYADVVVGAPGYSNGQAGEGRAFVYHGSASGLAPGPSWTAESDQASAQLGISVGTAGDVNGDGFADLIVGASGYSNGEAGEGRAFVYHGSLAGLPAMANWTAESDQAGAGFARSVMTAGDVDGDGYADVIVGSPFFANGEAGEGRAFAYHGSASGLLLTPSWTAEGNQVGANLGFSVGTAGDANGDGYADVIVGAPSYDNGQPNEGLASVYFGAASGLATSAGWSVESDQADANLGYSVATAGDVNGDGYADVVVGAPSFDNGQIDEGRALVFHGSASGPALTPSWTAENNQAGSHFGFSAATAGDVNGDGYSDVIVGAPDYGVAQPYEGKAYLFLGSASGLSLTPSWTAESDQQSAQFGIAVAGAGDVNGDGYADVIVGAYGYNNGQANQGRVFVFHGSASGLSPTANWTVGSSQAGAFFGASVASAGDVTGDGYADVIVGAAVCDGVQVDEGRAWVYHGSPSGLETTPAWTVAGTQVNANLGQSVAAAGDVNGDGYADVIVGAPGVDSGLGPQGRAYLYQGSATGLSLTPAWTVDGETAGETFGRSLASAGDVNGDGYADVVVGAPYYTQSQVYEGRAYLFLGSASGLALAASWQAQGAQARAYFGNSAATAGDVNGDGYADVIVGAYNYDNPELNEGRVYLFSGSATGLSPAPTWTAESNQARAFFGQSVASAGDVNGDGFADVLVGATNYDNVETDEGRAFLFYGNSAGRQALPGQLRRDGSTPVQPWGASWDARGFPVRLTNTSPLGRQRVKIQLEACPGGKVFGDPACGTASSPVWTDVTAGAAGVTLSHELAGLSYGRLYRWRARTLYAPYSVAQPGISAPPRPAHGPWRRLSGQALEADIRVLDPDLIFVDGFESPPPRFGSNE